MSFGHFNPGFPSGPIGPAGPGGPVGPGIACLISMVSRRVFMVSTCKCFIRSTGFDKNVLNTYNETKVFLTFLVNIDRLGKIISWLHNLI